MKNKTCCFFGHRSFKVTENIKLQLYDVIERLIADEGIEQFLFGSASKFNSLCYDIVTNLKEKYPDIKRIYVRAEFPYINDDYREYLLKSYEDTYYPEKILSAGRAVYIERNFIMVDSSVCVVYLEEDYEPATKNKNGALCGKSKSGTKIAYEYALKKKIKVINVSETAQP